MQSKFTGAEIRKTFIDFFKNRNHTFVPSSSLVPGGDQTLLFTNAGMVQFKDVFLGTDKRLYNRAVNSQKCMRVAGKHNDLEDVGRDDWHHTFFEMLGNWSFGDYYKKEAINWVWELLTEIWGLDKKLLWATCFKDEENNIPTDEEAAEAWSHQPGFVNDHVVFKGKKENFWEMAETGPCGPCSEVHIDRGDEFCDKKGETGHICEINFNCSRFLEFWNLVFIQYNRLSPVKLIPLPAKHVDTGMGLERIVAILQGKQSNYKTDLFLPLMDVVMQLTGQSEKEREANLTPYRVIADHTRAAAFLIADGVVPGNIGRNYICRMIIRRASRFGGKIGLNNPFLAQVAEKVIEDYGSFYPELAQNKDAIQDSITREEERFHSTLDAGLARLQDELSKITKDAIKDELFDEIEDKIRGEVKKQNVLDGKIAFNLYTTHGLPFEITRDIAREQGLEVEEKGFSQAMEEHRFTSGAGKEMGIMGGEEAEEYNRILKELINKKKISGSGVEYDPYSNIEVSSEISSLLQNGQEVNSAHKGDEIAVILPRTCFYIESGGQVSDTGIIKSYPESKWEIRVRDVQKPTAGIIIHLGKVLSGEPKVGDKVIALVDKPRRQDIMRNHTATHLLHAQLRKVLGLSVRQAGSLVAPDRLRFDFTYPEALTSEQLKQVEMGVNRAILDNLPLNVETKPLDKALQEGAMALFGEKYGETVRAIAIGEEDRFSYELCGGTHVDHTGDIGVFLIVDESSVASGIRRIEAITGSQAHSEIFNQKLIINKISGLLNSSPDEIFNKIQTVLIENQKISKELEEIIKQKYLNKVTKELERLRKPEYLDIITNRLKPIDEQTSSIKNAIEEQLREGHNEQKDIEKIKTCVYNIGSKYVVIDQIEYVDMRTIKMIAEEINIQLSTGVVALGTIDHENNPYIVISVTREYVNEYKILANELAKKAGEVMGGGGGGSATLASAGGKDNLKLPDALNNVKELIEEKTKIKK